MRILFLTSRLPYPPDRGDRLRVYHFLRELGPQHEITLASFVAEEGERPFLNHLAPFCHAIHVVVHSPVRAALGALLNVWRPLPLQTLYYRSAAMQRLVDGLLARERFDAVYVHLFRMAPYVLGRGGVYRILDLTDVISDEVAASLPYRAAVWRAIYRLELPRMRRAERALARAFDETWLISPAEQQRLAERSPRADLHVVGNGVDFARFFPQPGGERPYHLLFVGHMGVFHNRDAAEFLAREVLPLVRQSVPDAALRLVGAEAAWALSGLARLPGVRVDGFVPDLNGVLGETAVFVAPLRFSAGVQNKVLEAMATAVPVVAAENVNRGLGAAPEREILLGSDAGALATQIVRLLQDAELRARVGQAGYAFVRRHFTWQRVRERMQVIAAARA